MEKKKNRINKKGFTLVEEVVSLLILSILILVASGMLLAAFRIYAGNVKTQEAQAKGQYIYNLLDEKLTYAVGLEVSNETLSTTPTDGVYQELAISDGTITNQFIENGTKKNSNSYSIGSKYDVEIEMTLVAPEYTTETSTSDNAVAEVQKNADADLALNSVSQDIYESDDSNSALVGNGDTDTTHTYTVTDNTYYYENFLGWGDNAYVFPITSELQSATKIKICGSNTGKEVFYVNHKSDGSHSWGGNITSSVNIDSSGLNVDISRYNFDTSYCICIWKNGSISSIDFYDENDTLLTVGGNNNQSKLPQVDTKDYTIDPASITMNLDDDDKYISVKKEDISVDGIEYEEYDTSVISVDESGKITAKKDGTTSVKVYYPDTADNSKTLLGTVNVTVNKPIIKIGDKATSNYSLYESQKVTISVENIKTFNLVSSDTDIDILVIGTDEDKNTVTAKSVGNGTITVYKGDGTSEEDKIGEIQVNVENRYSVGISSSSIIVGQTATITVTDNLSTDEDKKVSNFTATTATSDIVTISGGTVTGAKVGNTDIEIKIGDTVVGKVSITVSNKYTISIDPSTITVGGTATITVTDLSNNSTVDASNYTSSSDDESIATVSGNTVTGVSEGTATITVTIGTEELKVTVNVTAASSENAGDDSNVDNAGGSNADGSNDVTTDSNTTTSGSVSTTTDLGDFYCTLSVTVKDKKGNVIYTRSGQILLLNVRYSSNNGLASDDILDAFRDFSFDSTADKWILNSTGHKLDESNNSLYIRIKYLE